MKAAVMRDWGGPDVLQIEEVAAPTLGPADVLVQVGACGIAYHDVVQRNGVMRRGTVLPMVLGFEIAGTVIATGPQAKGVAVGDRVVNKPWHSCGRCRFCRQSMETACVERKAVHGGYAEVVALPDEVLVKLPDSISFEIGCTLGAGAAVALNAVKEVGGVRLGETVLISGATGGVGLPAVQIARASGARVLALSRSQDKVQMLRDAGASEVLVIGEEDFSKDVRALVPRGVDVVVDTVGSRLFKPSFKSLALGGRFVMVGQLFREDISINPAFIFFQRAKILGVGSARRDQLEDVLSLVEQNIIRPKIAKVLPLDEIAEAHALVEGGAEQGRIIVVP